MSAGIISISFDNSKILLSKKDRRSIIPQGNLQAFILLQDMVIKMSFHCIVIGNQLFPMVL